MSIKLIRIPKFQNLNRIYNRSLHVSTVKCTEISGNYLKYDKDPGPAFIQEDTQTLLKSLTRFDFEKIFRKRSVLKNDVEYKFMTEKQIEDEVRKAAEKAQEYLQMPPVVKVLEDDNKVISNDPALKDFSESDFVFSDITFGMKNSDRSVVIRKSDGSLENAPYSVRKRVFQIYFPLKGREFRTPRMFEDANLKNVLDQYQYEFVLDRLCIQFEPFEPEFHEISSKVYQHINETKRFDDLRSTRHFGPIAFFLAWHKMIDDLLLDLIKRDYLQNAVELILLMFKLNSIQDKSNIQQKLQHLVPKEDPIAEKVQELLRKEKIVEKIAEDFKAEELCFEFVQNYIKEHGLKKNILELALQTYRERHSGQKTLEEVN